MKPEKSETRNADLTVLTNCDKPAAKAESSAADAQLVDVPTKTVSAPRCWPAPMPAWPALVNHAFPPMAGLDEPKRASDPLELLVAHPAL